VYQKHPLRPNHLIHAKPQRINLAAQSEEIYRACPPELISGTEMWLAISQIRG
jgi:hypothetical protein